VRLLVYVCDIGFSARAAADFHGHGARRFAATIFCEGSPRFRTPYIHDIDGAPSERRNAY